MKTLLQFTAITAALVATSATAATSGSPYPIGGEGVQAGSPPPPGIHPRLYSTWYSADRINDDDGNDAGLGVDLNTHVLLPGLTHVTDKKLFGAHYGYSFSLSLVDQEFSASALGIDAETSYSLGDTVIEPINLNWYQENFDVLFGLAVIIPTGDFDVEDAASPGLGYWSGMLTLGGTYYMGDNNSWSVSMLSRTIFSGKQDDTDIRPGAQFVIEGGIGKDLVLSDHWLARPGITYGASWQISDDSKDAPGVVADERKESYCVGAELNLFYLPWLLQANLRYNSEFGTKNTTEGSSVVLTLTKTF